tara:strand:+ start:1824 stop:2123 length:300 start_codon:yes stop_codon:yes gene_type:complete
MPIRLVRSLNTPHKQAAGIKYTPDKHFEDLGFFNTQFSGRDNPALRRLLVDCTNELIEWLLSICLVYARRATPLSAHAQSAAELACLSLHLVGTVGVWA